MSRAALAEHADAGVAASNVAHPCHACGVEAAGKAWAIFDHEYNLDYRATYHECPACGSMTQTPMPSLAQLASFYPPGYHSFSPTNRLMQIRTAMRVARLRKVLGDVEGAVLDYGCGGGAFLFEAARQLPYRRFYGYEIDSENSVTTHMDGRVTIYRGDAEAVLESVPPLAVACLNHVIEHLPDPGDVVARIANALAPGGGIDGQTPRADSLERAVFGARWAGFHAPRHTVVFSRSGLQTLLERAGFETIRISDAFNPGGIAISIGSALQGARAGTIRRSGLGWVALVGLATGLAPLDLMSGRGGIMDFFARRSAP